MTPSAGKPESRQLYLDLIDPVSRIVRKAGELIRSGSPGELQIELKSAANYVTETDLAVQKQILDALTALTPGYAVIAEESASNQYGLHGPTWILDPVDGTTNLMRGYRHSAVSLALADQNGLKLGFIYNPFADELFQAAERSGAWLNGRQIRTANQADLSGCLVGFGTTPYNRSEAHRTFALVEKIFLQTLEVRRSGAAALDLAYIACGRLDAFFELCLQPWDYAAGSLILQEAGGRITNWQGVFPSLRQGDSILATNGQVHDALLACLRDNSAVGAARERSGGD